ncbi:hypothetical protein [Methylobacterium sp. NEAU K]|uniref:hypothetical protein n=1 Tax=Methylobacterium sp. NEAU K TaxID=3064946 RepID=UPI0027354DE4|nr:hypothetical protein [Methylobacterium sp. NEAU K]MDP4006705.1 hypothetical protein [Methylobacterium sp. NEAU K]
MIKTNRRPAASYSGWALELAISLDSACPGLLAESFRFGRQRRQALFLVLALAEILGLDAVAEHLRSANGMSEFTSSSSATVLAEAVLRLRRPRDLVRAVLTGPPAGLLGTLARLGDDPIGGPRTYYELARLHLSRDPADQRRVKVLGQIGGNLLGVQIEIVSALDPVLLHPAFVGCLTEPRQVQQLHSAMTYIRARCSGATDDAIRASLKRLKPGGHTADLVKFWAARFDRPPIEIDLRGDPALIVLDSPAKLANAGRRYKNCLGARINEVFLGAFAYVEVRSGRCGEPGTMAELRHTDRGFVLEGLYAADNRRVPADRAQIAREKLSACGVALLALAPGEREPVIAAARLLNEHALAEPDNYVGWGNEIVEIAEGLRETLDEVA